jgi:plasmid stability protein
VLLGGGQQGLPKMAKKDSVLRPIMTRLREGLRKRLEVAAKANGRSMNAEIIHRLEKSFDQETAEQLAKRTAEEMFEEMFDKLLGEGRLDKLLERYGLVSLPEPDYDDDDLRDRPDFREDKDDKEK